MTQGDGTAAVNLCSSERILHPELECAGHADLNASSAINDIRAVAQIFSGHKKIRLPDGVIEHRIPDAMEIGRAHV